jgi:RNA polymerase sigma-70 factor (ECF subfamily)
MYENHDQQICHMLKHSPEKGLDMLIAKYTGYVWAIVSRKLEGYSRQDAEECASDVFYTVFQKRQILSESRGSLKAFICTVAKNKAIDYARQLSRRQERYIHTPPPDRACAPDDLAARERSRQLLKTVKKLNPADSAIIIRRFYLGMPIRQIAKEMHMKANTVSQRCIRATARLAQLLDKEDFNDD